MQNNFVLKQLKVKTNTDLKSSYLPLLYTVLVDRDLNKKSFVVGGKLAYRRH
jgi:hypothetical protein